MLLTEESRLCLALVSSTHFVLFKQNCCRLATAVNEQKTQITLWALLESPHFISTDLSALSNEELDILKAEEVIAINKDPRGRGGGSSYRGRALWR